MATLGSFVRSQIRAVQRIANPPRPNAADCLTVADVAARGPAALAGVKAGDLLIAVDGVPAGKTGVYYYWKEADERGFQFHMPARNENLNVLATGIDLGMKLEPTCEAVVTHFSLAKAMRSDTEDLLILWRVGRWEELEAVTARYIGSGGSILGLLKIAVGSAFRHTPLLLLLGAAQYERGDRLAGMRLINEYYTQHRSKWTTDYLAVTDYYRALETLVSGNKEAALQLLHEAFNHHPFNRIADRIAELGGERPGEEKPWLGEPFPVAYDLPILESKRGQIALMSVLEQMPAHRVLVVCLMAGYRGNGPYSHDMTEWSYWAKSLGEFLGGLHVITSRAQREEHSSWFVGEDLVRSAGLPIVVLHDAGDEVSNAIGLQGCPTYFFLDQDGTVVHQGHLSSLEVWDAIGAVNT